MRHENISTNYILGFQEGFRLVKGLKAAVPSIPPAPCGTPTFEAFQVGLKAGIRVAGGCVLNNKQANTVKSLMAASH